MLPEPSASINVNGPSTKPWVLPCKRRSAWNWLKMPFLTRYSAMAGGSARELPCRNSPMIVSSWPRSIRLLRRRSQTNHSHCPSSVVTMTTASFVLGRQRDETFRQQPIIACAGTVPGRGRPAPIPSALAWDTFAPESNRVVAWGGSLELTGGLLMRWLLGAWLFLGLAATAACDGPKDNQPDNVRRIPPAECAGRCRVDYLWGRRRPPSQRARGRAKHQAANA